MSNYNNVIYNDSILLMHCPLKTAIKKLLVTVSLHKKVG